MEKVTLNQIIRCDTDETEVAFTINGRKIIGIFPTIEKPETYTSIKKVLINTYIGNRFCEKVQKIGQKPQNMR